MNTSTVISLPSIGRVEPHLRLKVSATGVEPAGAEEASIGTSLPADHNEEDAAIQCKAAGLHYVTTSAATAIAFGDELQGSANGCVTLKTAGTAIMVAAESSAATGNVIRAVYL